MQLRFTIFTKLFHSVQFLTIRQSQLRIRFWCQKLHKNATPLTLTFSLNSTQAALTRAAHSNRRLPDVVSLADFRTGEVPGSEKPTPSSPKGDRRSVLSEKEIQDSDNCSRLRMGCPYCFHSWPFLFSCFCDPVECSFIFWLRFSHF